MSPRLIDGAEEDCCQHWVAQFATNQVLLDEILASVKNGFCKDALIISESRPGSGEVVEINSDARVAGHHDVSRRRMTHWDRLQFDDLDRRHPSPITRDQQ